MWIKTYKNVLVNLDNVNMIYISSLGDQNERTSKLVACYDDAHKSVVIEEFSSPEEAKEGLKNLNKRRVDF